MVTNSKFSVTEIRKTSEKPAVFLTIINQSMI